ncbi:AAA family ATPase [Mesorhizobium sp. M0058]|uniref:AAA family ATPase n=1 Tax=Mesorhizobium sp. M0058 TaxID=2956865 RepID=UPI0033358161
MFTRLSFENYRAFKKGSLRIAPITILVGANSIGKSSILQIPLLFKQTLDQTDHKYQAALKIHGKDVSFGSARQVFNKQDTSKPVMFKFS